MNYQTVHVAGSNGKGSVSAKIAAGLIQAGLKVGLYTSPHIEDPRERIRIGKEWITKELFELVWAEAEGEGFFEKMTSAAFLAFERSEVDIAVIETGIGGRLDPTNRIAPILSVITSISLEHCERLGFTVDAIATEKAGIIKEGVPVVLGAKAQQKPLIERAKALQAPILRGIFSDGFFDDENNEIASIALKELAKRYPITDEMICQAMRVRPRCRFEVLSEVWGRAQGFDPFPQHVVLDVAHNPDAMRHLYEAIRLQLPSLPIRTAIALSADKDLSAILAIVKKQSAAIEFLSIDHPRLASSAHLAGLLKENASPATSIEELLRISAEKGEILLFCGSFFMMSAVRGALKLPSSFPLSSAYA